MESIIKTIDFIGYQGPILISLITFFSLLGKPTYLIMYIVGSILNHSLNSELKLIIKEPRPKHPISYIDDDFIKGAHIYGMPSGHAQISSFAVTYSILTKRPMYIILPSLFIYMLTLIQRWKYRRHTIEQLVVGTIVGSFISYITIQLTEIYLKRANFFKGI